MEVIGFRSSSPAGIILQYIKRHGQATIKELEQVLGVSTTAVREHLAHLQVSGLVETDTVRHGPGRPRLIYTLTEKAQTYFPRHYDMLINLILEELSAEGGPERVDRLLQRVGERLRTDYAVHIHAEDLQERLGELRETLEARGVPAEVEPDGAGFKILSCPYHDVAQEHGSVCTMEKI
ncbi:MAG: DeoR family transcriptional regulator, partial [Blastochloris sp.]|nr:DeoR family transcriptional regulator [Blastochloris sp.]